MMMKQSLVAARPVKRTVNTVCDNPTCWQDADHMTTSSLSRAASSLLYEASQPSTVDQTRSH